MSQIRVCDKCAARCEVPALELQAVRPLIPVHEQGTTRYDFCPACAAGFTAWLKPNVTPAPPTP